MKNITRIYVHAGLNHFFDTLISINCPGLGLSSLKHFYQIDLSLKSYSPVLYFTARVSILTDSIFTPPYHNIFILLIIIYLL